MLADRGSRMGGNEEPPRYQELSVRKIHKDDLKNRWLSSPNTSFREEVRVERGRC